MDRYEGSNGREFSLKTEETSPRGYLADPRVEELFEPTPSPPVAAQPSPLPVAVQAPPLPVAQPQVVKKRRGRPRKYPLGSNGLPISPPPISSSGWRPSPVIRPVELRPVNPGDTLPRIASPPPLSAFLMPYTLIVNAGEDITMKVISYSQQDSNALCIISAHGVVSNVTLGNPRSSGTTLTYEGRFDIISLMGFFTPSDNGRTKSRSGGMSISMSDLDGNVIGGVVAGMLVAESSVQVVVGSYPTEQQLQEEQERASKKRASKKKATYEGGVIGYAPMDAPVVPERRCEPPSYNNMPAPHLAASASYCRDIASTSRANPGSRGTG